MQASHDELLRRAAARHKARDVAEAARLYQEALRLQPRSLSALNGFALLCFQCGKFAEAESLYAAAMREAPSDATAAYNRGCALLQLMRGPDALSCFEQALAANPNHVGALINRAVLLQEQERSEEALADCDRALALQPDFPAALVNRGNALLALRRLDEALAAYERALAATPGLAAAEEGRAIVTFERGGAVRAPAAFLRQLYAKFSAYYDEQMVGGLGYCGHSELRRLADGLQPPLQAPLRIWDLGCGTGLAGIAFKDLAAGGRLDGVDLSPPMLEAAQRHGIYDSLVLADVEEALAAPGLNYDLVLAADTLIYFGDLAPIFDGVAKHLMPAGLFLFTVEASDAPNWQFGTARRYQHARAYIERTAAEAGFAVEAFSSFTLRTELTVPVPALAVALRRR